MCWCNIHTIKDIVLLFELLSRTKVNLYKSIFVGVNVEASWLNEVLHMLNCKVRALPFRYLILTIINNSRNISFWSLDQIRDILSPWKGQNLSMDDHLILLKSTLTSLPVYFLSLFKVPSCMILKIESLFKSILWGGSEEARKIHLFHWNKVCLPKQNGGLGVRNVKTSIYLI